MAALDATARNRPLRGARATQEGGYGHAGEVKHTAEVHVQHDSLDLDRDIVLGASAADYASAGDRRI